MGDLWPSARPGGRREGSIGGACVACCEGPADASGSVLSVSLLAVNRAAVAAAGVALFGIVASTATPATAANASAIKTVRQERKGSRHAYMWAKNTGAHRYYTKLNMLNPGPTTGCYAWMERKHNRKITRVTKIYKVRV